jgi:hypothetical protein
VVRVYSAKDPMLDRRRAMHGEQPQFLAPVFGGLLHIPYLHHSSLILDINEREGGENGAPLRWAEAWGWGIQRGEEVLQKCCATVDAVVVQLSAL